MSAAASDAPHIALISPCGWGNLGDAAIQQAVIDEVRARFVDAEFTAFTLNPADTRARHAVPAFQISGHSNSRYGVVNPIPRWYQRGLELADTVPLLWRVLRPALGFVYSLLLEAHHLRDSARRIRDFDLLLISGGGQLDDFYGGSWCHPYALFKWTALARIASKPIAFLSVGAGEVDAPLTRFFLREALEGAAYRSYRDEGTARIVADRLNVRAEGQVVPDLALAIVDHRSDIRGATPGRLTIAVSPMLFDHTDGSAYVKALADLLESLLEQGHTIVFFATATQDRRIASQLRERLLRANPGAAERVQFPPTDTVDDVLTTLRAADVAIASRLHSVILAHVTSCPVLAISYDRKVTAHMQDIGQAEHCLLLEDVTSESLSAAFSTLAGDLDRATHEVRSAVAHCRPAITNQYDQVLYGFLAHRRSGSGALV